MNYQDIYSEIITFRKFNLPLNTYTEKHHIIPVCLGGTNKKDNLVVVTSREHYLLHHLLMKIYPENKGLKNAYIWIKSRLNIEKNSSPYQCIRKEEYSKENWPNYGKYGISSPRYGKHYKHSEETKLRMSIAKLQMSEETKKKIGLASKKRWKDESYRQKHLGKHLSDETKLKMSESKKGELNPNSSGLTKSHKQKIADAAKKRKGKILVNNGLISTYAFPDSIPEGFVKGKLIKILTV